MKKSILIFSLVLGIILGMGFLALAASSLESEIKWIDKLSDISLISYVNKSNKSVRNYNVSTKPSKVIEAVRSRLKKRGWKFDKTDGVTSGTAKVSTIYATKGSLKITITMKSSGTAAIMNVAIKKDGTTQPTKVTESPGGAKVISSGESLIINENNVTAKYKCSNNDFIVNSNSNNLALLGVCKMLTVNGNSNTIKVNSTIESIIVNGNKNRVSWSRKRNPKTPEIINLGSNNTITRGP
ncbi:MAG: DUF3060 domain-containing protein [Candidatus Eremiobacteraeota bacterium]|nr:DUF3060 domain-containing protein [Candidatus Eremiobacteraeota bacterium]